VNGRLQPLAVPHETSGPEFERWIRDLVDRLNQDSRSLWEETEDGDLTPVKTVTIDEFWQGCWSVDANGDLTPSTDIGADLYWEVSGSSAITPKD